MMVLVGQTSYLKVDLSPLVRDTSKADQLYLVTLTVYNRLYFFHHFIQSGQTFEE